MGLQIMFWSVKDKHWSLSQITLTIFYLSCVKRSLTEYNVNRIHNISTIEKFFMQCSHSNNNQEGQYNPILLLLFSNLIDLSLLISDRLATIQFY